MGNLFTNIKQYRQLILSVLFFSLFSFSVRLFAAPFNAPATLDPSCVPGGVDCYVVSGGGGMAVGGSITSATAGSVLFAGAAGVLAQDNGSLFWNDASNRLGIGTTTPTTALDVAGTVHSLSVTTGTILATGSVGIQNNTPGYALDVGSAGYASGYVPAIAAGGTDMHITGTYTGTSNATYVITVDGGNDVFQTPNTIQVTKNGNVVYSGFPMDGAPTAGPLLIGDGLSIGFDDSGNYYSDHDTGDAWTITATASGDINTAATYRTAGSFFGTQETDGYNLYIGKDTPFTTAYGTENTFLGIAAGATNTSGASNTLVGAHAGYNMIGGGTNTFVGNYAGSSVASGGGNTFFGQGSGASIVSGSNNVFIGASSTGSSALANAIAIGSGATVTQNSSIALGTNATTTLANQMVIGSSSSAIDNIYIGNGVTAATAGSIVLNASGGNGSNKAGGNLTLAGGKGTGAGTGGSIIFSTSDTVGGASTLQTLTEKARISTAGVFTIGATPTFQVDANGDITKLRGVTTTFPAANAAGVLTNNGSGTLSWGAAITTIGTIDSVGKSANGAVISGANLIMQNADASFPGLMSTGTQTLAGAKTFSSSVNAAGYTIGGSFFVSQSTFNMAIGLRSVANTFPGIFGYNLYVGPNAGKDAGATTNSSTYIGVQAGLEDTSSSNTYVGAQAGGSGISGGFNTVVGANAGGDIDGSNNALFGATAGNVGSFGSNNTLIGFSSSVGSGVNNAIAIGSSASSNAGAISIGVGASANVNEFVAGSSTTALTDVYLGQGKTHATPSATIIHSTGGSGADIAGANLVLAAGRSTGAGAGGSLLFQTTPATGSSSTLNTLTTRMTIDTAGKIYMHNLTSATGNNAVCINAGTKELTDSGGSTCTTSSLRFKHDIVDLDSGLDTVLALRPISYRYNSTNALRLGLIAEEVQQVEPRLVFNEQDGATVRGVNYEDLTAVLVKAVQEMNIRVEGISGYISDNASIFDQLIAGIVSFKELIADKITTKELCLEDVCIDKSQLQQLLQQGGVPASAPGAQVEPLASAPDEAVVEPVLESVEEEVSAPEPAPEPLPEPQPEPVLE